MILFGATKRYIDHLEREIEVLRGQLWKDYRPPQQQKKREHDPPPASLVEICSMFEQAGPRILQEAIQEHVKHKVPYEVIKQRIRGHIEAHSNGTGE